MSADKRSVHTDALETLGFIHTGGEARDAIHLAVEPVTAGMYLNPGAHVARGVGGKFYNCAPNAGLGIVDPFITGLIRPNDKFWLVVYPRKISSLRHVWTHEDFDDLKQDLDNVAPAPILPTFNDTVTTTITIDLQAERKAESEQWIRDYIDRLNNDGYDYDNNYYGKISYEEMMSTAKDHANEGWSYLSKGGLLEGVGTDDRFWDHFEIVTGITPKERGNFFSCSC